MINDTTLIKANLNALESVVEWFSNPERVAWHALSRIVRALFTPLLQVALGILVKRIFGFNTPTSLYSQPTQIALLRRYINSHTLSKSALRATFSILGTHYEAVSVRYGGVMVVLLLIATQIIYRAMGAKIGRRVRFITHFPLLSPYKLGYLGLLARFRDILPRS